MIDLGLRIRVAPGKTRQAFEWEKKMIAYSKKVGLAGPDTSSLQPITGEAGELFFVARHESMAAFEEIFNKRQPDSPYIWTSPRVGL